MWHYNAEHAGPAVVPEGTVRDGTSTVGTGPFLPLPRTPRQPARGPDPPHRILLVSSAGGVFQDLLALEPWWSRHDRAWAVERAADTEAVLKDDRVHWLTPLRRTKPRDMVSAVIRSRSILRRELPTFVISAGSSVAVPFFLLAAISRIPTAWLTSLNLISSGGLSGRVCCTSATFILAQRSSMLAVYPRAIPIGELY